MLTGTSVVFSREMLLSEREIMLGIPMDRLWGYPRGYACLVSKSQIFKAVHIIS
jgi:hypothetical protein